MSFDVFASPAEAAGYIEQHLPRMLETLARIPDGSGPLLEIGAAPFSMTLLLRRERRFDIRLVNYGFEGSLTLSSRRFGESATFPCAGTNVECEPLPYPDRTFDVVLCAEVLEHLTFDPTYMLCEIHRVLRPEGRLVLTTPNVLRRFLRYRSLRALVRGGNVHGPYSGFGPYGRHNREFTPREVRTLVEGCGFSVAGLDVLDVPEAIREERRGRLARLADRLLPLALAAILRTGPRTLTALRAGQIILTAVPDRPRTAFRPEGLYVSQQVLERARERFPRIP
jgi:SAM-dependent methyltransferase